VLEHAGETEVSHWKSALDDVLVPPEERKATAHEAPVPGGLALQQSSAGVYSPWRVSFQRVEIGYRVVVRKASLLLVGPENQRLGQGEMLNYLTAGPQRMGHLETGYRQNTAGATED